MRNYIVLIFFIYVVNVTINLSLRFLNLPGVDYVNVAIMVVYFIMIIFFIHHEKFGKWMNKRWMNKKRKDL